MFKFIVIVDQSYIIREGLSSLIRANRLCQQLTTVSSLDDLECVLKNNQPDLVVLNVSFAQHKAYEKLHDMLHSPTECPFIGLVSYYHTPDLLKQFADAIYITDKEEDIVVKLQTMSQQVKKDPYGGTERLTEREKEVLRLLVQGLSNKEVADKLIISTHTVITHRKNIVEKTNIRSLSGLAVYAIINNICDMDDISH